MDIDFIKKLIAHPKMRVTDDKAQELIDEIEKLRQALRHSLELLENMYRQSSKEGLSLVFERYVDETIAEIKLVLDGE